MGIVTKIIGKLMGVTLGKEAAFGLTLLRLIREAIQKKESKNLSAFVYERLPSEWKAPEGPTTEREFVALIKTGEEFLRRVLSVTSK